MPGIRLVSTDFDGTLIGHPSDGRCVPALARELASFKATGGWWVVNTGRSLSHAIEGVAQFDAPAPPDFLITHEREIYRRNTSGQWEDFGSWNEECHRRHRELFERAAGIFAAVRASVAGTNDVTLIPSADGWLEGLITSDEVVMERVAAEIDALRADTPKFSYQRNTIYLRFAHADYSKGTALAELRRLLGVAREETFAAGDHYNDLSMLSGEVAAHVACPSNAIAEAKDLVRAAGGWVAALPFGNGSAWGLAQARASAEKKEPAAA